MKRLLHVQAAGLRQRPLERVVVAAAEGGAASARWRVRSVAMLHALLKGWSAPPSSNYRWYV